MKKIFQNKIVKNILSALAIAFFGLILLNLTFIFDALYQGIIRGIVNLFIPFNPESRLYWLPFLFHGSFVIIIGLISWPIFISKIRVLFKAIYMTVPTAVILVTLGMFLSNFPIVLYSISILLCIATLYLFYKTKQSWLYYYTVILVSLALTIYNLLGGEI
ncbi:MAG: hypothetical protein PHN19_02200 [Patescibacteria group bacterium]|nr:hypothetical protein [Patescibacteria group bacterium]